MHIPFDPRTWESLDLPNTSACSRVHGLSIDCSKLDYQCRSQDFSTRRVVTCFVDCNVAISQGCIVRLALVLLTGVVAVVLPSFGMILSLLGCVCFSVLGFVVPSLAHLKLFGSQVPHPYPA